MLSKCLNPHCSANFQYLGQGRLFRVDFAEAGRKSALAGREIVTSIRSRTCPIEHFWLCESCATTMTIHLSDAGEVRLVSIGSVDLSTAMPTPQKAKTMKAAAS